MNPFENAYKEALQSGHVPPEVIARHTNQQAFIDRFLPKAASFFYLVEPAEQRYHFLGRQQAAVSGYPNELFLKEGVTMFLQCLDPDEASIILSQIYPEFSEQYAKANAKDKQRLMLQYNYRFRRITGEYIQLMEQVSILEADAQGRPSLILGHVTALEETETARPIRASAKIFGDQGEVDILYSKTYGQQTDLITPLTSRELEVLRLVASGQSSKAIADILYISHHTVDTHRRRILKKLKCSSSTELTRLAFIHGLI